MRTIVRTTVLALAIGCYLPLASTAAEPLPVVDATFQIQVTVRGESRPVEMPDQATVTARWFGVGEVSDIVLQAPLGPPKAVSLRHGRWLLTAATAGYWGAPAQIVVQPTTELVALDLWPEGQVIGTLTKLPGETLPEEVRVFARPANPDAEEQPPEASATCPVNDGEWWCSLPAGKLDLRFQSQGFVPRYRWGVDVAPGQAKPLGQMALYRGASVFGWVVTEDGTPIASKTVVRLEPRTGGAVVGERQNAQVAKQVREASIDEHGFFQMDGVAVGGYRLSVDQAPFAPTSLDIEVHGDRATEISDPPLELIRPRAVEIQITPPVDVDDRRWQARLSEAEYRSGMISVNEVQAITVSPEGEARFEGLAAGEYLLRVESSAGETWWDEPLTVHHATEQIDLDLPIVTVRGDVRLGDEPLRAMLYFGGRDGSVKITVPSDRKGEFETKLPKPGPWRLTVEAERPQVSRNFNRIEIEPDADGIADIELRLPNTVVRGTVIDEAGFPADALVTAAGSSTSSTQIRTEPDGSFVFRALPEGQIHLAAEASGGRASDTTTLELTGHGETAPVELVLYQQLKLEGTIVSHAGPVPGARVTIAPIGVTSALGVRSVAAGPDGRFMVRLPGKTQTVRVSLAAPGFAYRVFRLPLPHPDPLVFGVEQNGGTLIVALETPPDWLDTAAPVPYVVRDDGSFEFLGLLNAWARSQGVVQTPPTYMIPNMEPGTYRFCWLSAVESQLLQAGLGLPKNCDEGTLSPFGELTLDGLRSEP